MPPPRSRVTAFIPSEPSVARVQDFKDGAETEVHAPKAGRGVGSRSGPSCTHGTPGSTRIGVEVSCPPRRHLSPVFDISAVLVQYRVPFVALGRAALGLARTCRDYFPQTVRAGYSPRRRWHNFCRKSDLVILVIPSLRMRYGIVRHKQAVAIFVLLCILLGGRRRRREFVGVHRSA